MRKTGILILFGLLGIWVLGCAPSSQIVKNDAPEATPTPSAIVPLLTTATPTSTETAVPAPTRTVLFSGRHVRRTKMRTTVSPAVPMENVAEESETACGSTCCPPEAKTVSAANSMATATAAIATATVEAAVPAAAIGRVSAGGAGVLAWTPTPVVDYTRASTTQTPVSIGKLFMGIGFLILLGGILYVLRQLQDARRVSRSLPEKHNVPESEVKSGGQTRLPSMPATPLIKTPEREPEFGQPRPRGAGVEPSSQSAVTPDAEKSKSVKSATRRRKTAAAAKTPKKAALRAARPTVKTVRLSKGKRAQAPVRKRRPAA